MSNPCERLAEIEARVEEDDIALATYAREDIPWLLEREKKLREALEQIVSPRCIAGRDGMKDIARQALADSGEAGGEAG